MDNPISSINVKVYKGIAKERHNKGVCLFKRRKKKGKYEIPHSLSQALTLTLILIPVTNASTQDTGMSNAAMDNP